MDMDMDTNLDVNMETNTDMDIHVPKGITIVHKNIFHKR
jgi:hypothetical protein